MHTTETYGFQTEVKQLLQLMIHALYSNKEIFVRELVSNASDALDKLRFLSVQDDSLVAEDSNLRIEIDFDKEAGTLTIRDNGVGMSKEEVVQNLEVPSPARVLSVSWKRWKVRRKKTLTSLVSLVWVSTLLSW